MPIEAYDLLYLRTRVAEEFGLDESDTTVKARIDKVINDALSDIVLRYPRWPWLRTRLNINVQTKKTGKGNVTQGSSLVDNLSGWASNPAIRDILVGGSSGNSATSGYLVDTVTGNPVSSFTIQPQWLGQGQVAYDLTLVSGWFQLPTDFNSMEELELKDNLGINKIEARPTAHFEKMRLQGFSVPVATRIYVVTQDPLGQDGNLYIGVYPYLETVGALSGYYWRQVPKLVSDSDTPIIPPHQRIVLLRMAEWFMAAHLRLEVERIGFYRARATAALESMQQYYEISEEMASNVPHYEIDYIQGPPGYPRFTD